MADSAGTAETETGPGDTSRKNGQHCYLSSANTVFHLVVYAIEHTSLTAELSQIYFPSLWDSPHFCKLDTCLEVERSRRGSYINLHKFQLS